MSVKHIVYGNCAACDASGAIRFELKHERERIAPVLAMPTHYDRYCNGYLCELCEDEFFKLAERLERRRKKNEAAEAIAARQADVDQRWDQDVRAQRAQLDKKGSP